MSPLVDRVKDGVRACLLDQDYPRLIARIQDDPAGVRKLFSLLYDAESLLRWRAVVGFGMLAEQAPQRVERIVSRLAYALNDEASICAWSTAPAVAEMAHRQPALTRNVVRIVVHYFEDVEACQSTNRNPVVLCSALWAVGRIGVGQPQLLEQEEIWPTLAGYTADPLPEVRGHAYWAIGHGRLLAQPALQRQAALVSRDGLTDGATVAVFDPETGEMPVQAVGELARQALRPVAGTL